MVPVGKYGLESGPDQEPLDAPRFRPFCSVRMTARAPARSRSSGYRRRGLARCGARPGTAIPREWSAPRSPAMPSASIIPTGSPIPCAASGRKARGSELFSRSPGRRRWTRWPRPSSAPRPATAARPSGPISMPAPWGWCSATGSSGCAMPWAIRACSPPSAWPCRTPAGWRAPASSMALIRGRSRSPT